MSVIDEVKQKLDIAEVIGQYVTLKKSGRNLSGICPFHTEKNPSFYVYPEQQSWHCFGACNTGGDVFSFIMKKENLDFGEALRLLAARAGVEIPEYSGGGAKKEEKDKLYKINEAASMYFHNLLLNSPEAQKARDYLERRGISPEVVNSFQLGFSLSARDDLKKYLLERNYTESEILEAGLLYEQEDGTTRDRFRNRLMFPIKEVRGHITGFGARVLDDSLPKYMNSPQSPVFDKSGTLYGIDIAAAEMRKQDLAVIVEGYMDVITAHKHGFTNVVASMGTAVTEKQVDILKKLTRNLVLALDADTAGEEAMLRCVDYENTLDSEIRVAVLPEGKDPDNVIGEDKDAWPKFIEDSLPVVDFAIKMVSSRLDLSKARDQSMLVNTIGSIVNKMKDPIRKAHYTQRLAQLTDKEVRTVEAALAQMSGAVKTGQTVRKQPPSAVKPVSSSRTEEDCLALLLRHPELRNRDVRPLPEYFGNSENREIYTAWQQAGDIESLKESLDPALHEHLEGLVGRNILVTEIDARYNDYVLRLQEDYLKSVARKRASLAGADPAVRELPGEKELEVSTGLREIFSEKAKRSRGQRRN